MIRFAALIGAIALAGCSTTTAAPTQATSAIVQQAQEDIRKNLRDPDSGRFGSEFQAYSMSNGETAVCGTVNAANAFGGMTGMQPVMVNYRAGRDPLVFIEGLAAFECQGLAQGRSARL